MSFGVNDSPLAGKEGTKLTSNFIKDRLVKETDHNPAVKFVPTGSDSFEVSGRGELQMSVLIENMRREVRTFCQSYYFAALCKVQIS